MFGLLYAERPLSAVEPSQIGQNLSVKVKNMLPQSRD
jgi:hypothetical protein